jgi:hypothetical protein
MSCRDRVVAGCRSSAAMTLAVILGPLLLSGCSNFRQIVGIDPVAPDEFAVESRAPLTIPPDFDLRPPKPGAPRPQEATAAEKARKAIDTAGPGEPGKQATAVLKPTEGGLPSGTQIDPSQQVSPDSLAAKLLGTNDTAAGGAVDKRETSDLKGVH